MNLALTKWIFFPILSCLILNLKAAPTLFTLNTNGDVTQATVCKEEGVSNCTLVTMNFQALAPENSEIYVPDIGTLDFEYTDNYDGILNLNYHNENLTTAYITYYALQESIIGTFTLITGETRKLAKCGDLCYVFYKVTEKKWTDDDGQLNTKKKKIKEKNNENQKCRRINAEMVDVKAGNKELRTKLEVALQQLEDKDKELKFAKKETKIQEKKVSELQELHGEEIQKNHAMSLNIKRCETELQQSLTANICIQTNNLSTRNEESDDNELQRSKDTIDMIDKEMVDVKTANKELETKLATALQYKEEKDEELKDAMKETEIQEQKISELQELHAKEKQKNHAMSLNMKDTYITLVSSNSDWSDCSEKCGEGTQKIYFKCGKDSGCEKKTFTASRPCKIRDCVKPSFDGDASFVIIKESGDVMLHGDGDITMGVFMVGGGGYGLGGGGSGLFKIVDDVINLDNVLTIKVEIGEGGYYDASTQTGVAGKPTKITVPEYKTTIVEGGQPGKHDIISGGSGWSGGGSSRGGDGGSNGSNGKSREYYTSGGELYNLNGGEGSGEVLPLIASGHVLLSPGKGGISYSTWFGGGGGGVLVNGKGPADSHRGVGQGYGGGGRMSNKANNGLVIIWIM
eukprot:GFUD01092285.1.p1 GENE.GFUD01092285.1~~GFUD01092285.1.p1  ORF type:complete len:630 (+),score=180.18 GFUD01092285.1:70-1959(+)